jgi:hypothetical protein
MQVHGSCHCGRIQYEAFADPVGTTICHCTDCQNLTGSAYRVSVPPREGSFRLITGQPTVYVKLGESGARRAQAFCPHCGSPLYTYDADTVPVVVDALRVGCIVERAAFVPRRQQWCRSAQPWTESLAGMEREDTQ